MRVAKPVLYIAASIALLGLGAVGAVVWISNRDAPLPQLDDEGAFADYIAALGLAPLSDMASDIEPGTVLAFQDESGRYTVIATREEAFPDLTDEQLLTTTIQDRATYRERLDLEATTGGVFDVLPGLASASAELRAAGAAWMSTRVESLEKQYLTTLAIEDAARDERIDAFLESVDSAVIVQAVYTPETLDVRFARSSDVSGSLILDQEDLGEIGTAAGATRSDEGWLSWRKPVLGILPFVAMAYPEGTTADDREAVRARLESRGLETQSIGNVLVVNPGRNDVRLTAAAATGTVRATSLARNLVTTRGELDVARRERQDLAVRTQQAEERLETAMSERAQLAVARDALQERERALQGELTTARTRMARLQTTARELEAARARAARELDASRQTIEQLRVAVNNIRDGQKDGAIRLIDRLGREFAVTRRTLGSR